MGVGLPYAMGAYLADPSKDVCCITGEGSIQMNIQELSTCFQYRLPVKIICLNNGYLGMVRQWQELYYGERESETYFDSLPDFVKLAVCSWTSSRTKNKMFSRWLVTARVWTRWCCRCTCAKPRPTAMSMM